MPTAKRHEEQGGCQPLATSSIDTIQSSEENAEKEQDAHPVPNDMSHQSTLIDQPASQSLFQEEQASEPTRPSSNFKFKFNHTSPIRPSHAHTRAVESDATPLLPRLMARGHIVNFDHLPMITDASFSFTGDSIDLPSPPILTSGDSGRGRDPGRGHGRGDEEDTFVMKKVKVGSSNSDPVLEQEVEDIHRLLGVKEDEMKEIRQTLALMTIERDQAISQEEARKFETRERRLGEIRRGIVDELERSVEYRGWLDGMRELISQLGRA